MAQVGFHSLRHAHITAQLEGGIPMDVVRQQASFASLDMTAHYTHIGIEAAQNAVALLPDVTHADAEDRGEGCGRS